MAGAIINGYYNTLKHLRVAEPYLQDINLINQELKNFNTDSATDLIDYLAKKHRADFTVIGKHLTGIMIFKQADLPEKSDADLVNDLRYIQNCIIISAAVHCGLENTLKSAMLKLSRAKEDI